MLWKAGCTITRLMYAGRRKNEADKFNKQIYIKFKKQTKAIFSLFLLLEEINIKINIYFVELELSVFPLPLQHRFSLIHNQNINLFGVLKNKTEMELRYYILYRTKDNIKY